MINTLMEYVAKSVGGVYNFDPSDIDLIVAGRAMQDFTALSIVPTQKRRTEQGVDVTYHTFVDLPTYAELSISVFPSCSDLTFLTGLQKELNFRGGWFEVTIKSNGRFIGTYDCYFQSDSSDSFSDDGADKSYNLVGVKQADDNFTEDFFNGVLG